MLFVIRLLPGLDVKIRYLSLKEPIPKPPKRMYRTRRGKWIRY
jgi:hypothetical protein